MTTDSPRSTLTQSDRRASAVADVLSQTRQIARGSRQRSWLLQMLDPEHGLHPSDGETGRWAGTTYGRIARFATALRCEGFSVHELPLGPRGGMRWLLDPLDFNGHRGTIYRLLLESGESFEALRPWNGAQKLATTLSDEQLAVTIRVGYMTAGWRRSLERSVELARVATPALVDTLETIAAGWTGSFDDFVRAGVAAIGPEAAWQSDSLEMGEVQR